MVLEGKNVSFAYTGCDILLQNISIAVASHERVGLVARSGFGKTTLAKLLAGYETPTSGVVAIDGKTVSNTGYAPVQMIHQHPERMVNPRWRMEKMLAEGDDIAPDIIDALGIQKKWLRRFPHELSGGELQRFCIARALGKGTKFLIADEISTMLDGVTQCEIWNFLLEEVTKRNIGVVVVSHNPHLLERVCTRIIDFEELCQNTRLDG